MERSVADPDACARVADWLAAAFQRAGVPPTLQRYHVLDGSYANVLASRAPLDPAVPTFVLGAHYDTVPGTPGADDNASGVAVLLEVARLLGPGFPPHLLLAAFCTEEASGVEDKGSHALATHLMERGHPVAGMLSLEMVGYFRDTPGSQRFPVPGMRAFYGNRGDFLAVISDLGALRFTFSMARKLRRAGSVRVRSFCGPAAMPGIHWSDHAPFRKLGYRAAMLTDTAFHRNPHYHLDSDVPGTLDYTTMDALARMLAKLLSA